MKRLDSKEEKEGRELENLGTAEASEKTEKEERSPVFVKSGHCGTTAPDADCLSDYPAPWTRGILCLYSGTLYGS